MESFRISYKGKMKTVGALGMIPLGTMPFQALEKVGEFSAIMDL
jgi:hypothetical protein